MPRPVTITSELGEEYDEDGHCQHVNAYTETTEVDCMRNGEHDTYETLIAVCDNPKCDGITDSEMEALTEPEEPDYEPDYED